MKKVCIKECIPSKGMKLGDQGPQLAHVYISACLLILSSGKMMKENGTE